jgi:uncharacterized protein Yka (UPF0111/DUF47 family)
MSALQRLLGRDDKFYRLLESSAAQSQTGAEALVRLLSTLGQGPTESIMGDIDQSRRSHKRIGQEITEGLFQTFSTPIEREDIESLSNAFYKISKSIEKIAERLIICPPGISMDPIRRQVSLLEQGTSLLVKMTSGLSKKHEPQTMRDSYDRIQAIEGDADRIMNEQLRDLYRGEGDARSVVFWKDIYELVEKGIDRCRDAGGVLFHIVLKNS